MSSSNVNASSLNTYQVLPATPNGMRDILNGDYVDNQARYVTEEQNGRAEGHNLIRPNDSSHRPETSPVLTNGAKLPSFASQEPIAICGMALRLPGGLHSPQQLWNFLIDKGDAHGPVPKSRYNVDSYHSNKPRPCSVTTQNGYFLDESVDIASIDTSFFNMKKTEVARTDPQQRLMLEVALECMEDAAETQWKGRPIGCYMGSFGEDWAEMFAKDSQQYGLYRITGYGDFMLPNRVSYELDITGPSMVVRTGCSAALVALHEACLAISRGDCEGAIVGGANLIMAPGMTTAMSEQSVLAPDGTCKTFSADADGYGRGEAISAIYVKPLAAAIQHGNPIRAVIRATSSNSDGKASNLLVPNDLTQETMIRRAYEVAGITDYSQTAFVECHGTGTPVGDPIETKAVGRVFGPSGGVLIGSVKPNLGHSEGASGLTSLIKSVLALENRCIPPNINFKEPNPKIPWESCRLSVPTEAMPWPETRKERISVNSFGIGGANAHVILDSARSYGITPAPRQHTTSAHLMLYSANTLESLTKMTSNYEDYIVKNPDKVRDLAFTLGRRRDHLAHRAFAVVSPLGAITTSPPLKTTIPPKVVMVFTGQGAQWPQMSRHLIQSSNFPVFKRSLESLDAHLQTLQQAPSWSIVDELQKSAKLSRLSSSELSQPLCTAIQVALVDLLASAGVEPVAVVGHSSGEIAAAYAAGAITANEAISLAFYRGLATTLQTKAGAMAAVGMGAQEVQCFLQPGITVACENSSRSVTLAGDKEAIELTVVKIKEARPDVLARLLQVDKAYHSSHMSDVGATYQAWIEPEVVAKDPSQLFFSSVTPGVLAKASCFNSNYWRKNLESPVLFHGAISSILQHPLAKKEITFLEVGPHSALAGPLRQIQAEHSNASPYTSTLIRNQNDLESFLNAVGKLHSLRVDIDLSKIFTHGSALSELPRYPWNHAERFWYESRLSKEWRLRQHEYHDLLGLRVPESLESEILFRNMFHLENASWIRDHKVGNDIVFPFAGYAAMIGEAVRQISGVNEAYKLRNVVVSTALVLNDGKPVEIMTTLRRQRLTHSLDSEWWEFTIASHNGSSWVKHCFGDAKSHNGSTDRAEVQGSLARRVATRRCYDTLARSGLNFGPAFRRLNHIRSDTIQQKATAEVTASGVDDNDDYHLHPTIIDASLQLFSVAVSKGYTDTATKTMVPTYVKDMCAYKSSGDVKLRSVASYTLNRSVIGDGQMIATDGKIILSCSGVRLSAVDDTVEDNAGEPTVRTEWRPHLDFLELTSLIKPSIDRSAHTPILTELSQLCMTHTQRVIAGLSTSISHMHTYRAWIDRYLQSTDRKDLARLKNVDIEERVDHIVKSLEANPALDAALAMQKMLINAKQIFTGDADALDLLISDGTLTRLYAFMDQCDESDFFKYLTHSKPNLRVLEIGAGTGGSTVSILKLLTPEGRAMYSKYTFTDISSGFFVSAKERFSSHPNMEYATLDISKNLAEQGFDGRKYDLIIATNVIHATRSLHESLSNVRRLVADRGRLLLHESCSESKWGNYIWGTLAGWWYGESDGRANEPYVDIERWSQELKAAGFCEPDAAVLDSAKPNQLNAMIVARPALDSRPPKKVTVLTRHSKTRNLQAMIQVLKNRDYTIHICRLEDSSLPIGQDVIALLDDEDPFFEDLDQERWSSFKSLVSGLGDRGLLWITGPSQVGCQDPRFGQINGVARTIRSEMLVDFATCEVDDVGSSLDKITDVFEHFQARQEDETLKPEYEYAIVNNVVQVGRIHPFSLDDGLSASESTDHLRLCTQKPGRLSDLYWAHNSVEIQNEDDVAIEVYATGLNFRDVLCAMGIVETSNDSFGSEASGIVRHIGPGVKDVKVGDRVMLVAQGAFTSNIVVPEALCEKIPDDLSFEDAATMPCVFATSIYSIFTIGNLKRGQSILIHSACGGVGLATIQLAQMTGAEIYATVGNEEKINYLMETFNLPRNRIFNSRNISFVEDIMRETKGSGVDLALNSLSGELLHATWQCVAAFGTMVEIGKRDLLGSGKLDMSIFLQNRSYRCVDLDQICSTKPEIAKELLQELARLNRAGYARPIRPIKVFQSSHVVDAFRYMQQGIHLGKIVVSMRDDAGNLSVGETEVVHQRKSICFDSSGVYLLVGGLGGLGRSVSSWMVKHGARHIIYLSRSAGLDRDHLEFANELSTLGCHAEFIQGSSSNFDDVTRAVAQARGRLKGIMQMSMVLCDQSFVNMTVEEWTTAVTPKIQGTWNLHRASVSINAALDFFVLFSSISGVIGRPGQINYAGSNTFLDAFSQFRTNQGLPACSVQIGAVEEVGYVAEHDSVIQRIKAAGAAEGTVSEQEFLEALEGAIMNMSTASNDTRSYSSSITSNNFCLGFRANIPMNSVDNRALWKKDIRMAVFHNRDSAGPTTSSGTNDVLRSFLAMAKDDASILNQPESIHTLAVEIGKKVFNFLMKPEEELRTDYSLSDLGMDSLVAIEVRQWWKATFQFDISVLEMMGMGSLDALGEHAAEGLMKLFHGTEK